ncbi:MAG: hypothetical protein GY815_15775 [Gammaproteobacteria bacterium]|nr:hypothetical protein [Gammaproteobacteria bacterium]
MARQISLFRAARLAGVKHGVLQQRIRLGELRDWIDQTTAMAENDDDTIGQPFVNETFLRVMTAQTTVLPGGHEFFVENQAIPKHRLLCEAV